MALGEQDELAWAPSFQPSAFLADQEREILAYGIEFGWFSSARDIIDGLTDDEIVEARVVHGEFVRTPEELATGDFSTVSFEEFLRLLKEDRANKIHQALTQPTKRGF